MPDHIVIPGDALEILPNLPDGSVDAVITDPPYNTAHSDVKVLKGRKAISFDFGPWDYFEDADFLGFTGDWIGGAMRALPGGGNLVFFAKMEYLSDLRRVYESLGFRHHGTIIWHKTNPPPKVRKTGFLSSCEGILWATKGFDERKVPYTFNFSRQKEMHNFIETPICMGRERTSHPTQKPLKVVSRLIEIFTNPGDLILDPFAGSGTVAAAASEAGRRSISIEKDEDFLGIMKRRLEGAEGGIEVLEGELTPRVLKTSIPSRGEREA